MTKKPIVRVWFLATFALLLLAPIFLFATTLGVPPTGEQAAATFKEVRQACLDDNPREVASPEGKREPKD